MEFEMLPENNRGFTFNLDYSQAEMAVDARHEP